MTEFSSLFFKHKKSITFLSLFLYGFVNSWIASITTIADYSRIGTPLLSWEAYTWSFTSFIMTFVLIFYVSKVNSLHPLSYGQLKKNFSIHIIHSILFSIIHVLGMVFLRKVIYKINNRTYDFGYWPTEFIYEYRKDFITYFIILAGIYIYQSLIKQLQGDASIIKEKSESKNKTDKILIKKKGKEFIINLNEISTIESGGNYIYLNTNNSTYPMRSTMNKMEKTLDPTKFIRVHRSYIVNIDFIKEIISSTNQDYKIILKNNKSIPLSRTYRTLLLKMFNR